MKNYYKLLLILVLISIKSIVSAQVLPVVQNAFNNYQTKFFKEKIFVHTDKDVYVTGELIWFKLYNVDAADRVPVSLSKVAYVEILDQKNNQVLQAKIELKEGSGSGSIYVPVTISNGAYKLRAYTNWMQNFGAESFFEKKITLINPGKPLEKQTVTAKIDNDLQFFPEGGDLVDGVTCNVAFKAVGADGNGLSIKGIIINQQNDTIAKFQSLKFGIGRFTFTPSANQTYKAIATSKTGDILIKELPKVNPKGSTLMLTNSENKLTLNFATAIPTNKAYLVVHNGKKITLAESAELNNGKTTFQFREEQLNDGISHLTIFSDGGVPISERLFFKKPAKKLNIAAYADFLQYTTRKKVTVSISTTNEKEVAQNADLSIAVHRLDSLQGLDQSNLLSYMWLQSELKGSIEEPNYYFTENREESAQALDNLLLSQGWSRFNWDEILKSKAPIFKFLPEYNGHLISGTVTRSSGSPIRTNVYMSSPGKKIQFYGAESDSTGNFKFNTKDFYGINELVLQTNYLLDSTSTITVKSPFSQQFNAFNYPQLEIKSSVLGALKAYNLGAQVQNVYANTKLKRFYFPEIDSASFYGRPFRVYKLDDYVRFPTMEEVLREYVREVFVSKRQKNFHLNILADQALLYGDPLVLLDGVPYFNIDKAMELDPIKIEKLAVINQSYFYGSSLFDGILSFSSYKGNLADIPLDPRAIVIDYEGMQLQREFYVPLYETAEQRNSRIPDFRNQLYWSPKVILDKTANGKVDFYTSDQPGNYVGIVEGITNDGIPGSKIFTFEVKK